MFREENDAQDIFDKVMKIGILKPIFPIYSRHKEGVLYLFFGGITFSIGICIYVLLFNVFAVHELISNFVSWICGVTFSFFSTKKWVFKNSDWRWIIVIKQMINFYMARLATLLLQEGLLFLFVTLLKWDGIKVKLCTEIINIIINYIVSKFIIFKRSCHE